MPRGCFTDVLRALQHNLAKIYNGRNRNYDANFKLKVCTWCRSMALGTRTNFQLEILSKSSISAIYKFRENVLESSWNVSETLPWLLALPGHQQPWYWLCRIGRPLSYLRWGLTEYSGRNRSNSLLLTLFVSSGHQWVPCYHNKCYQMQIYC